jgi:hypothetical protein
MLRLAILSGVLGVRNDTPNKLPEQLMVSEVGRGAVTPRYTWNPVSNPGSNVSAFVSDHIFDRMVAEGYRPDMPSRWRTFYNGRGAHIKVLTLD